MQILCLCALRIFLLFDLKRHRSPVGSRRSARCVHIGWCPGASPKIDSRVDGLVVSFPGIPGRGAKRMGFTAFSRAKTTKR